MPSKIEWTDETWNPVTGCTAVSTGCDHCYARRMANRLRGRCGYPQDDPFNVTLYPDRLDQPLHWRKPRMIFVCSMGDLFHKDVPNTFIGRVFASIIAAEQHTFLMLTKRPKRMKEFVSWFQAKTEIFIKSFQHIWLGVSVEDQKTADERIPILLQVPAAKRVVSVEPMLAKISLRHPAARGRSYRDWDWIHGLGWVICGGETGPGARPMHPEWPQAVKNQCVATDTPFFFKSRGEWDIYGIDMFRVGKKQAGRLLDGREWNQMPEVK